MKKLSMSFCLIFGIYSVGYGENWNGRAQQQLQNAKLYSQIDQKAKNVILMIGDGMSVATITAARIYDGQLQEKKGESHKLALENLPYMAMSKTYSANMQTTDSAAAATAIMTGVKTNNGIIAGSDMVKLGACSTLIDNKAQTLFEIAAKKGLSVGIVTTTRLTHATPAASYAHSADRDWESDQDMPDSAKQEGCTDIARQFVEFNKGKGINVALGGGESKFRLKSSGGQRSDEDLIQRWQMSYPEGVYVETKAQLENINNNTKHLFGLFSNDHMPYVLEKEAVQNRPSLAQMTKKAIEVLSNNKNGYILIVEGGRIDHAHHANLAKYALAETIAFDDAVDVAKTMTDAKETLLIVTADHSQAMAMSGYAKRGNPILGVAEQKDNNGNAYTTLTYTTGSGDGTHPDGLNNKTAQNDDYRQKANIPLGSATHSGEDVVILAQGPGASLFQGIVENYFIFHVINEALGFTPESRAV
ncbi:MAG: alkaline phosphatase [Francisellaceae bacterium]